VIDKVACAMCDRGFPLNGRHHYGTQALGMIPDTICEKRRRGALIKELASLKRIADKPPEKGYDRRELQIGVWDQESQGGVGVEETTLEPGDIEMVIAALSAYRPPK